MPGAENSCVVIEAEGVLLQGAAKLTGELAGVSARKVFQTSAWLRHARGELSAEEAHARISALLGVRPRAVADAVAAHRDSWSTPPEVLDLLDALAAEGRRLYCLAVMPAADWKQARQRLPWVVQRFTGIATTAEIGAEPASGEAVARLCARFSLTPRDTVYIGGDQETLQFTRAHGIRSVHYRTPADLWRLRSEASRLQAAEGYVLDSLTRDDCRSEVLTGDGRHHLVDEAWSLFYLLDASPTVASSPPGSALLRELARVEQDGLFNFMRRPHPLTKNMPTDADDTAIALTTLHTYGLADDRMLQHAADCVLANTSRDGLLRLYFHTERPRVDSVVCASALALLHLAGRHNAPAARKTEDFLYTLLRNRGYQQGSLYTPSPDFYLYALYRVMLRSPAFRHRFQPLLTERLTERIATSTEPAGQALRVIMCRTLGLANTVDYERLLAQQQADGSWDPSPAWLLVSPYGVGRNRALDTTLAAQAIRLTLTSHPNRKEPTGHGGR